jgi:hypothetical protein
LGNGRRGNSVSLPATASFAEPSKLINMVDHVTQGTMVTW